MPHHHHRNPLPHSKKPHEEEEDHLSLKPRSTILRLLFLLLFSFLLIFLFSSSLYLKPIPSFPSPNFFCPSSSPLCCDRSSFRTDICFLDGDIRSIPSSLSLLVFSNSSFSPSSERLKPYTRKWEQSIMSTINEIRIDLLPANNLSTAAAGAPQCDVIHNVTAVVFSTGGYTGNVYHEFNDGLIPLYLTSRRFNRHVVFVIEDYHDWWVSKYGDVVSVLSNFPPIDLSSDGRIHCFTRAVVGLRIHDDLSIEAGSGSESMNDFRRVLNEAYAPRIRSIVQERRKEDEERRPKLVVICRNGSRAIENESELVSAAEEVGFRVVLIRPTRTTEMAKIYMELNSSDAMIGVHGAAMTHLLFMRPGSVLIQIVPLGLEWAAENYYGRPAAKAKLMYESYRITRRESSLSREFGRDDPVLKDPESVNARGWEMTKKVYLDGQSVNLDLVRFRKRLVKAHRYLVSKLRN